ncbi:MAG: glycosyltransferase [Patescibacteria group bacterium]
MRIVFLASGIRPPGGIQKFSTGFVRALQDLGHEVFVISRDAHVSKLSFVAASLFAILRRRPDFVLCGHVAVAPLARIALLLNIPFVVCVYGIEAWSGLRSIEKSALRKALTVIAISDFTKEKVSLYSDIPAKSFFMLPPFVDGAEFYIRKPSEGFMKRSGLLGKKVIFTLARLSAKEQYKGYDFVLEVLPRLVREIPNLVYVLAGEGSDIPRIRELARNLNVAGHLVMPGFILAEDILDYYGACDVFVMPSTGEGFGIVFLEAIASGKPAIGGNIDASKEALRGGELGKLINPHDSEALFTAIRDDFRAEGTAQKERGELLRRKALEYYGYEAFRERVAHLVREISESFRP